MMKNVRAVYLVSIAMLLTSPACKSKKKTEGAQVSLGQAAAEAPIGSDPAADQTPSRLPRIIDQTLQDKVSSEAFRDLFFSLGKDRFTADDLSKLVFLPTPELLALAPKGESAAEKVQSLTQQFERFKPSDLFEYGKSIPSKLVPISNPQSPITLVVVPGIFSEFIDTVAFQEVVSRDKSSFAVAFKNAMSAAGKESSKIDSSFDFESQGEKSAPLSDFIRAGSIDDKDGKPLVQIMTLASPMFSGESLGRLEDNAEVYIRRLNKAFDLMGAPEQMVVVGYSRGAMVALEMLSTLEAQKASMPWVNNIKAMLSVGGVLYGAALADAGFDPKDPLNGILARLQSLTAELELVADNASTSETLAAATRNTKRWLSAGKDLGVAAFNLPKSEGLSLEDLASDLPHLESNLNFAKKIAFEKFNFADPRFDNYFLNIRKFKWIIGKAIDGIDSLRTETRIAWWKSHVLPSRLMYFSIAGTMGDVSTKEAVWSETGNRIAFATKAVDYFALRMNYYELYRVSKLQVSDSQVSLERSRFLPELNYQLNPAQGTLETYYLGVLGVDHWGMIFPYATMTQNQIYSPFPRDLLAKSLGLYIQNQLAVTQNPK